MFKLYQSVISLLTMVCISCAAIDVAVLESKLAKYNVYFNQNGNELVMFTPLENIFQGDTKFLEVGSSPLIEEMVDIVAESGGQVILTALLAGDQEADNKSDLALKQSIAYSQVAELSSLLLQGGGDISYAPLTVKVTPRNDSYGFWKKYPNQNRFVMMTLRID